MENETGNGEDDDEPTNGEDDDLPSVPFPASLVKAMDLSPAEMEYLRRTGKIPDVGEIPE